MIQVMQQSFAAVVNSNLRTLANNSQNNQAVPLKIQQQQLATILQQQGQFDGGGNVELGNVTSQSLHVRDVPLYGAHRDDLLDFLLRFETMATA